MNHHDSTSSIGAQSTLAAAVRAEFPARDNASSAPCSSLVRSEEETARHADEPTTDPLQETDQTDPASASAPDEEEMTNWASKINAAVAKGVSAVIEIGQQLLEAKKALGHGNFQSMIEKKVCFGVRQAEKYMRIAQHPTLSNPNFRSALPGNVTLLNALASINDNDRVKEAVEKVQADIRAGKKVNLHSRATWVELIPPLGQQTKPDEQAVTSSKTSGSVETPSTTSDDGGPSTLEGKDTETDTPTDTATVPAPASASAASNETLNTLSTNQQETDQGGPDPEGIGHPEATKTEEGDTTPEVKEDDFPSDRRSVSDGNVTRLGSHVVPAPDLKSLTEEERKQAEKLYHVWEKNMKPELDKYPKKFRIIFLQTLLAEEQKDENQKEAA